MLYINVYTQSL